MCKKLIAIILSIGLIANFAGCTNETKNLGNEIPPALQDTVPETVSDEEMDKLFDK